VQRGGDPDGPDDHDDFKKVKVRVKLHSHPALMEYIKRAKQAGIAENVLIDRLRTKGWNGDEIYEAFRSYKKLVKKRS
jgi:predicted peroxiredoxin